MEGDCSTPHPCKVFTKRHLLDGDKPAGSAKHKGRLTLLIITNMDSSDHRKLSVIGKSKTQIKWNVFYLCFILKSPTVYKTVHSSVLHKHPHLKNMFTDKNTGQNKQKMI